LLKVHSNFALEQIAELFPETFCRCSAGFFLLSSVPGRELVWIDITRAAGISQEQVQLELRKLGPKCRGKMAGGAPFPLGN